MNPLHRANTGGPRSTNLTHRKALTMRKFIVLLLALFALISLQTTPASARTQANYTVYTGSCTGGTLKQTPFKYMSYSLGALANGSSYVGSHPRVRRSTAWYSAFTQSTAAVVSNCRRPNTAKEPAYPPHFKSGAYGFGLTYCSGKIVTFYEQIDFQEAQELALTFLHLGAGTAHLANVYAWRTSDDATLLNRYPGC